MAIREFWIWKSSAATFAYEKIKADNHPSKDELIHVIDATGMPSKEELRQALHAYDHRGEDISPEFVKVIEWLKQLAAE